MTAAEFAVRCAICVVEGLDYRTRVFFLHYKTYATALFVERRKFRRIFRAHLPRTSVFGPAARKQNWVYCSENHSGQLVTGKVILRSFGTRFDVALLLNFQIRFNTNKCSLQARVQIY